MGSADLSSSFALQVQIKGKQSNFVFNYDLFSWKVILCFSKFRIYVTYKLLLSCIRD